MPLDAVRITVLIGVIGSLGMSSCERQQGIERKAEIQRAIDVVCIRAAIKDLPGISGYEEWSSEAQLRGTASHAFHVAYTAGEISVQLAVFAEGEKTRFVQTYVFIDRTLSRSEIETARRLMVAVEDAVGEGCNLKELSRSVRETCVGDGC